MKIEPLRSPRIASDFAKFIGRHRVQRSFDEVMKLLEEKDAEIERMQDEIDALERDLRVTKDLLAIAGATK